MFSHIFENEVVVTPLYRDVVMSLCRYTVMPLSRYPVKMSLVPV